MLANNGAATLLKNDQLVIRQAQLHHLHVHAKHVAEAAKELKVKYVLMDAPILVIVNGPFEEVFLGIGLDALVHLNGVQVDNVVQVRQHRLWNVRQEFRHEVLYAGGGPVFIERPLLPRHHDNHISAWLHYPLPFLERLDVAAQVETGSNSRKQFIILRPQSSAETIRAVNMGFETDNLPPPYLEWICVVLEVVR